MFIGQQAAGVTVPDTKLAREATIGALFHGLGLNLEALTQGIAPKPATTFGNVKADVLEWFVPGYRRGNFVNFTENSAWPE